MAPRWLRHDDDCLSGWYVEGISVIEIGRRLGRSSDAVDARRRALGLCARRPHPRRWFPSQDALLCASAEAGVPARVIAEHLGLPLEAVRRRRRALVPRRPRGRAYQAQEDAALREAISAGRSLHVLAAQLDRSEGALRVRARTLGIIPGGSRRRWTPAEDQLLREGYERGLTCHAVALTMLSGKRTPAAVSARAGTLGLVTYARAWTGEDDAVLTRLALAGASLCSAAERLGRTAEAIRRRAAKLGVRLARDAAPAAGSRWTAEEDAVLREFAELDPSRLSSLLGRSDRAILRRLWSLGLGNRSPHYRPPSRPGLTQGELALIARECRDGSPRRVLALARRLGRSPGELRRVAGHAPTAAVMSVPLQPRAKRR